MSERSPASEREAASGGSRFQTTLLVLLVGVAGAQTAFVVGLSRKVGDLQATVDRVAAVQKATPPAPPAQPAPNRAAGEGSVDEKIDALRGDFDVLVNDIQRMNGKLDDLTAQLENRGTITSEPAQPPELDWTAPDLFETARNGADSVGFTLTKDEVRCPSRLVLKEGALEYLVVLKGGKEHETLFTIVGNTAPDMRRAKDMGVKLNNALQAIGFKRGTPIRFGPTGTTPAKGETVRLYVEWTTGGVKEIVRAEDLALHMRLGRPMKAGTLVYVGSRFVPGDQDGTLDFAADLTAEVVATYSSPATMIDNTDDGAQDDTEFLVASPRIPDDVLDCTLIFRKTELPGVKEFPPPPVSAEEGPKGGTTDDGGK